LNPPWKVIEYELLQYSKSLAVAVAAFFGALVRMVSCLTFCGLSSQFIHHIERSVSPFSTSATNTF
jgi:hypothetical protein